MAFDDDYLNLPSKFDIHEYEIMERFGLSIPNEKISDTLLSVHRQNIWDTWGNLLR
jgi:hypothetical protein